MPETLIQHEVLAADEGRIDSLVARLVGFSRARVRGLINHGGVRVNDQVCEDPAARVAKADIVLVSFDPLRRYREKEVHRATQGFDIVYCDDHLAVVNKYAGILTMPTSRGETRSLVDLLSNHLNKGQARRRKVAVVHRLDRDTSGLLVFGRSPEIAAQLVAQFAGRKPEREYAAIVAGRVENDRGTVRSYLATDSALNQRSVSSKASAGRGELAITHFEVRARFANASLVAVNLETGRRNQIRVHMAEMGHPVLGDTRYRADEATHPAWPHRRLALHARVLGFLHPVGGRTMRFECPLPRQFGDFESSQSK